PHPPTPPSFPPRRSSDLFGDALDALQARLDTLDRLALLDRRQTDLGTWAAERKRSEAMAAVRTAGVRARTLGTDDAIRAYEGALDRKSTRLNSSHVSISY